MFKLVPFVLASRVLPFAPKGFVGWNFSEDVKDCLDSFSHRLSQKLGKIRLSQHLQGFNRVLDHRRVFMFETNIFKLPSFFLKK